MPEKNVSKTRRISIDVSIKDYKSIKVLALAIGLTLKDFGIKGIQEKKPNTIDLFY